jgi:disulfide bond formation protein DsbB
MTKSEFIKSQSNDELLAFIKKGRLPGDPMNTTGVAMPPKGGNPALTDAQLHTIIAYMRSLQQ